MEAVTKGESAGGVGAPEEGKGARGVARTKEEPAPGAVAVAGAAKEEDTEGRGGASNSGGMSSKAGPLFGAAGGGVEGEEEEATGGLAAVTGEAREGVDRAGAVVGLLVEVEADGVALRAGGGRGEEYCRGL